MRHVLAMVITLGATTVSAGAQTAGRCDLQGVFWQPGNDVHTRLIVGSGVPCRRGISSNINIEFVRAEVSGKARNGIAGAANAYTFAYKSNPGYVGSDNFQITFHIRQGGQMVKTRYNVAVEVVR